MGYAYSPDALVYDSGTNSWSLRPDYDHTEHRVEISITDNDGYLDGDSHNDEVGNDSSQTGTVTDMDGNPIASGQIYGELYYKVQSPTGEISYIDVMEIGGVLVGFIVSPPLEEGVSYTEIDCGNVYTSKRGETRLLYSNLASVPCFCQGTTLMTATGEQPVDWIRSGDRVLTKDHGFQPVLWADRTIISASKLHSTASFRPIKIAARSIDKETPAQDLLLSPEHRILLKSPQIELLFGCDEVFTAIKSVANGGDVAQTLPDHAISYYHIMFAQHEIVLAEGLWVESFFPGKMALAALPAKKQAQIRGLLGAQTDTMQTARFCLKPREAALLMPQNATNARNIRQHLSVA
ncbi:MAG: Hint domain-containing protein [Marinosulfonomonas sp.]|nr:Hint domain-containing protein [Marinosulfonomonas sp.]